MWLWTLNAGNTNGTTGDGTEEDGADDESEEGSKKSKATGFVLEYDAARKIAQGLGAHLEDLGSIVEVSGEQARLLPVAERAAHLFGKGEGKAAPAKKKKTPQLDLFKVLEETDGGESAFGETKVERHGETVLDRIHQPFEHEARLQTLVERQQELEKALDITRNQAPNSLAAEESVEADPAPSESVQQETRQARREPLPPLARISARH